MRLNVYAKRWAQVDNRHQDQVAQQQAALPPIVLLPAFHGKGLAEATRLSCATRDAVTMGLRAAMHDYPGQLVFGEAMLHISIHL